MLERKKFDSFSLTWRIICQGQSSFESSRLELFFFYKFIKLFSFFANSTKFENFRFVVIAIVLHQLFYVPFAFSCWVATHKYLMLYLYLYLSNNINSYEDKYELPKRNQLLSDLLAMLRSAPQSTVISYKPMI